MLIGSKWCWRLTISSIWWSWSQSTTFKLTTTTRTGTVPCQKAFSQCQTASVRLWPISVVSKRCNIISWVQNFPSLIVIRSTIWFKMSLSSQRLRKISLQMFLWSPIFKIWNTHSWQIMMIRESSLICFWRWKSLINWSRSTLMPLSVMPTKNINRTCHVTQLAIENTRQKFHTKLTFSHNTTWKKPSRQAKPENYGRKSKRRSVQVKTFLTCPNKKSLRRFCWSVRGRTTTS